MHPEWKRSEEWEERKATAPLNITVTSEATETMAWRTLARQAVPMLERPEQFHIAQRKQLAQTICLLLTGDLELEDVFGDTEDDDAPGCGDAEAQNGDCRKEPW